MLLRLRNYSPEACIRFAQFEMAQGLEDKQVSKHLHCEPLALCHCAGDCDAGLLSLAIRF